MSAWVWVVPEEKGGIRWYSDTLWEKLSQLAPPGSRMLVNPTLREIETLKPSLIHIQHEYGCFGSKIPGRYRFPAFLREIQLTNPQAKVVATAHTVIQSNYRYPVRGRGWQIPLRVAANVALMPFLTRWWSNSTWGSLDAVVVQSAAFIDTIKKSGCSVAKEIPLFVPSINIDPNQGAQAGSTVVVFGFFSHDKAQDVVIRAMTKLPANVTLVLAGGLRRSEDQAYFDHCKSLIQNLGLEKRVKITGFVPDSDIDKHYRDALLVVAPFRESTGSGSIVQAFARGKATLASDLPVNRELVARTPGCLAFFRSEDAEDCALQIQSLLGNSLAQKVLSSAALAYAKKYSIENSIKAHVDLYGMLGISK